MISVVSHAISQGGANYRRLTITILQGFGLKVSRLTLPGLKSKRKGGGTRQDKAGPQDVATRSTQMRGMREDSKETNPGTEIE